MNILRRAWRPGSSVELSARTLRTMNILRPRLTEEQKRRVPPGQYVTEKWPVLHYGSVPAADLASWDFRVWGEVEEPFRFHWAELKRMPRKVVLADIHCVTRWSRLDVDFEGVPIAHILGRARLRPTARFVLAHSEQGYTTNLPIDVLDDDDVLLCDMADGAPLTPDHGYPLRLLVPKRYFWKSAKWLRGLQLLSGDQLGFWERYGYSNSADPWKEERYSD
jgi:DMSO/TMAO reductase YedYZ molybdopterin-dependent catalytic subunit